MNNGSLSFEVESLKESIRDPAGSMDDDLSKVDELLVLYPDCPELICLKADLHYELSGVVDMSGKERPIELYRKALKLDGNNYDAVSKMASYLYSVLEDYQGALPYFERSVALNDDENIYYQYADSLAALGRVKEAIDTVESSSLGEVEKNRIIAEIKSEYA